MAITTYAELQAAVASWLGRDDLTDQIPDFIAMCEAAAGRDLRLRQMIQRKTTPVDAEYETLPSDFLDAVSFRLNTQPPVALAMLSPRQFDAQRRSAAGQPTAFAVIGEQVAFSPAPDSAYTGELAYYAQIPPLSASNTSNWLLRLAPDVYLYGTLASASPYLREDERVATWGGLYTAMIGRLKEADRRAQRSGGLTMRSSVRW